MYILGISAYYHNSAAALIKDGLVVAAAEEERFTRIKFDAAFPHRAIAFCLQFAGISLAQVSAIVYYEKPLLKFERIVENFYKAGPLGYKAFIKHMPGWSRQKLFMRNVLSKELKGYLAKGEKLPKLQFSSHHLSHAASAYYCSPFADAAIVTIDGVGEWATASIAYGKGNSIETLKEMNYPHSLGLLYSAFTQFLGFEVNSGEYKLMGLAPYGEEGEAFTRFYNLIKNHIVSVKAGGSIELNLSYFDFQKGNSTANLHAFEKLIGIPQRTSEISPDHCNLALAIQRVCEEVVLAMATTAKQLTGAKYICLAGGVALNCVANGKLLLSGLFDDVFIQPAAGDAGGALGAALAAYHMAFGKEHVPQPWFNPYLGTAYSREEILENLTHSKLEFIEVTQQDELFATVAGFIAGGKIVGLFQGRMEWGPRALGNRSILADARNPKAWGRLNQLIKQRENFRPFAPVVLEEDANLYFERVRNSPYMLYTFQVKAEWRKKVSGHSLSMEAKLAEERSAFPAITHVDFSARVQTVNKQQNSYLYGLLTAYKEATGGSVLVNTSFNRNNEPIVCTPKEAINCFIASGLDYLVMENFIVYSPEK